MARFSALSITIRRSSAGYSATVTPSPNLPEAWSTEHPMIREVLIDRLVRLGYHLQDVADALSFADAEWGNQGQ